MSNDPNKAGIPEGSECKTESFAVSINKADTTRDDLQGLLAESKRLAEKQTGNIRRINDLLGFGSVHIDADFG